MTDRSAQGYIRVLGDKQPLLDRGGDGLRCLPLKNGQPLNSQYVFYDYLQQHLREHKPDLRDLIKELDSCALLGTLVGPYGYQSRGTHAHGSLDHRR